MTYCLGIVTHDGLVMASDCRTNAGYDQANIARKMHSFVIEGERVFTLLTSGNLSLAQSVLTILRQEFNQGKGLTQASNLYEAARVIGKVVRHVGETDGVALKADSMKFNLHVLMGGQIKGEKPGLYLIYPQGNPLKASKDTCFLQIGEAKYGKPILDRGISYAYTTLEQAAKYALLSMDATIRSNVTVGPPIDICIIKNDELSINLQRRYNDSDPDLVKMHSQWELSLRKAVTDLPDVDFSKSEPKFYVPKRGQAYSVDFEED
jgi:putative proteasome-type protease